MLDTETRTTWKPGHRVTIGFAGSGALPPRKAVILDVTTGQQETRLLTARHDLGGVDVYPADTGVWTITPTCAWPDCSAPPAAEPDDPEHPPCRLQCSTLCVEHRRPFMMMQTHSLPATADRPAVRIESYKHRETRRYLHLGYDWGAWSSTPAWAPLPFAAAFGAVQGLWS